MKKIEPRSALGEVVKARRLNAKLSQQGLADIADVDRSFISRIERGAENPSVEFLYKIAEPLKTPPSEMLASAESKLKQSKEYKWLIVANV